MQGKIKMIDSPFSIASWNVFISRLCLLVDSSGEEPHERRRPHRQGQLRRQQDVQANRHGGPGSGQRSHS